MLEPTDRVLAKKLVLGATQMVKNFGLSKDIAAKVLTDMVFHVSDGDLTMAEALANLVAEVAIEQEAIKQGIAEAHG